jgi:broad specificity phosphatase PhoE
MSTRLDLLCQASTAGLRAGAFPADEPIDSKGQAALLGLAGRLRGYAQILRSPALAAAQTAESLGLSAVPEPALRDGDFGRWAGRGLAEIQAQETAALALWLRDPEAAPHGGESFANVLSRVGEWMDSLPETSGALLAIAPAAALRAAIVHALGAAPRSALAIDVAPLGRARLSRAHGVWRLSALVPVTLAHGGFLDLRNR